MSCGEVEVVLREAALLETAVRVARSRCDRAESKRIAAAVVRDDREADVRGGAAGPLRLGRAVEVEHVAAIHSTVAAGEDAAWRVYWRGARVAPGHAVVRRRAWVINWV